MNIEKFETPVLEVEEIETRDVITNSDEGDNDVTYPGGWGRR